MIKEEPLLPMSDTFVNDHCAKDLSNNESEKPFSSETFVNFKKKKEQADKLHKDGRVTSLEQLSVAEFSGE